MPTTTIDKVIAFSVAYPVVTLVIAGLFLIIALLVSQIIRQSLKTLRKEIKLIENKFDTLGEKIDAALKGFEYSNETVKDKS